MIKSLEGITKKEFIKLLNQMEYRSDWSEVGFFFVHPICYIGKNIGLKYIENPNERINVINKQNAIFYPFIDVKNFDELVPLFNSFKPIQVIDNKHYIIRDNYNKFLKSIGREEYNLYWFRKLKNLNSITNNYELIKKI